MSFLLLATRVVFYFQLLSQIFPGQQVEYEVELEYCIRTQKNKTDYIEKLSGHGA